METQQVTTDTVTYSLNGGPLGEVGREVIMGEHERRTQRLAG